MKSKISWNVQVTDFAENSINVIRNIVENIAVEPNPEKKFIPLSIGDPTLFGNLQPADEIVDALVKSITSGKHNGYLPAAGLLEAREAVARYVSVPDAQVDAQDVFLTSGASHALDLCIALLGGHGKNVLMPRPGFPLYKTLAASYGIDVRSYNLLPEDDWQVDLDHMQSLIDANTVAIIYNNPSNPCGSVFSVQHIKDILRIAQTNCLPVIADEIYEDMVFPGHTFVPIASLTTEVPVLSCRGTTKRFLIPGLRLGWITIHDRHERLGQPIRKGLNQLCQRIMGPNGIIQGALESILRDTPQLFHDNSIQLIKENAEYAFETFKSVPGLRPIKPSGAMYIMVGIEMNCFPGFDKDLQLIETLVSEESVFCLPGDCFEYPNYMRLVLTVPKELTMEACNRIRDFCFRHYVPLTDIFKDDNDNHLNGSC
ncbi:Tyrosine aminotransferase [Halotydeus destructor]|nr:Tyrosine aminotransferase [Halotydeus destructor]